jgi:hypothetical protein
VDRGFCIYVFAKNCRKYTKNFVTPPAEAYLKNLAKMTKISKSKVSWACRPKAKLRKRK